MRQIIGENDFTCIYAAIISMESFFYFLHILLLFNIICMFIGCTLQVVTMLYVHALTKWTRHS